MNENLDLTKILKNCPSGYKFWSSIYGDIEFVTISSDMVIFNLLHLRFTELKVYKNGKYSIFTEAECVVFPSKDQRDWSKFTAPWYKKERFDPKTLKPFDKVLVFNAENMNWQCSLFSHYNEKDNPFHFVCIDSFCYQYCIPYNDETKHLVGTIEKAPEYYRYWEK